MLKIDRLKVPMALLGIVVSFACRDGVNATTSGEASPPETAGTLGEVRQWGHGEQDLVVTTSGGFSADIFREFAESHAGDYTTYAVTLAGFSGTSPPTAPLPDVSAGDLVWVGNAVSGIEALIRERRIQTPILVGHLRTGGQIALQVALRDPTLVVGLILAGSMSFQYLEKSSLLGSSPLASLEERIQEVDANWRPWFESVSEQQWRDGLMPAWNFSKDPGRAEELYSGEPVRVPEIRRACFQAWLDGEVRACAASPSES